MTRADVAVIIPAHNRERVLGAALESVARQRLQPAQVIVVDDGSSDGTASVAAAAAHITLLRHQQARGSGAARNTGIAEARTTWIAFLDSDDQWAPDHLEQVMAHTAGHVLVTTPMVDTFGRVRGNISGEVRPVRPEDLFFPENIVCTSTVVASREAILRVGGFGNLPRAQDLDLWLKLLEMGSGVAMPNATATYATEAVYQESGLRERSVAGAARVRTAHASKPWMTRRLSTQIRTLLVWDDLRHAQHRQDVGAMVRSAAALSVRPGSVGPLARLLMHRRRARRMSASMGVR